MSDYTEEMGATRVVPGSQYSGRSQKYTIEESLPAVMKRGSGRLVRRKVYNGAGANNTDKIRQAINITYAVGWVRQEENQYLSTPLEIARTLPDDILKVMGYQMGCFALGYVRDFEDPMVAIREPETKGVFDVGMIAQKADKDANAAVFVSDLVT